MNEERAILGRLLRRLRGERASVMFEFAVVAPLAMMVAVFAADFTRVLRTEQQLEIATRLAADVEAHMADYHGDGKTPSAAAKGVAKYYLADVAHVVDGVRDVYVKGDVTVIKNPISFAVAEVAKFLDGKSFGDNDNVFLKLVGKILGGIMNFVTFRTVRYLTDIIPHDREVRITTAAYIPTILPAGAYEWLGLPERGGGKIGVGQFTFDLEGGNAATAWNLDINVKKRHRTYCFMPVIDSVPMAPETYVRKFKAWCAKQPFLKGLVQ
ncbi:MAG: pilus assembly protein [Kiritimatiellae bacterium]|nr:pilus assembly protein [Kiritimatiellia bacterium]